MSRGRRRRGGARRPAGSEGASSAATPAAEGAPLPQAGYRVGLSAGARVAHLVAGPMSGAGLVMPGPKLDGASLYELLDSEKVTLTAAVPTVWVMLLKS